MRRTTVAEPDADDNGGAARMARCTDADENGGVAFTARCTDADNSGGVAFTARCTDADYDARATDSGPPRRRQVRRWPKYGQKPREKGV